MKTERGRLRREIFGHCRALDIDDDGRRMLLSHLTDGRAASLRTANLDEMKRLADELASRRPQATGRQWRRLGKREKKLLAMWYELFEAGAVRVRSLAALEKWVERNTANHCQRLEWLTGQQVAELVEMLKQWKARIAATPQQSFAK